MRGETGWLVRFAADAAALAQAEDAHATITRQWVDIAKLIDAVEAAVANRYATKNFSPITHSTGGRLWVDRAVADGGFGQPARQRAAPQPRRRARQLATGGLHRLHTLGHPVERHGKSSNSSSSSVGANRITAAVPLFTQLPIRGDGLADLVLVHDPRPRLSSR